MKLIKKYDVIIEAAIDTIYKKTMHSYISEWKNSHVLDESSNLYPLPYNCHQSKGS